MQSKFILGFDLNKIRTLYKVSKLHFKTFTARSKQ